jgi:very-short-patch-repair endonuclease
MPYPEKLLRKVSFLRRNSTSGERRLWNALQKNRALIKLKFRRQHPIGPYIADFYCHSLKCIIELDGPSHDGKVTQDKQRDDYMNHLGITVFRFTERDAYNKPETVIETILAAMVSLPHPLPEGGESGSASSRISSKQDKL